MSTRKPEMELEMLGMLAEDGSIGGQLNSAGLLVPPAPLLRGTYLVWPVGTDRLIPLRHKTPAPDLLVRFARLESGEDVLSFSTRWGPLDTRGRLFDPNRVRAPIRGSHSFTLFLGPGSPKTAIRERVQDWLNLATQVRSMLNIAGGLHLGELGKVEDWDRLDPGSAGEEFVWSHRKGGPEGLGLATEWDRLGAFVNGWLRRANVRPMLDPVSPRRVALLGRGMFGVLGIQLLFAIAKSRGIATCSNCGKPYAPKRRPNPERRRYCPECGKGGAPERDASKATAKRRTMARELHADGLTPTAIAARVGAKEESVRRWIADAAVGTSRAKRYGPPDTHPGAPNTPPRHPRGTKARVRKVK